MKQCEYMWHIDWGTRLVNHTLVCVAKQSVHEDSMAWLVAEVVQDIGVTASSMTSNGGLSREHQFQQ